MKLRLKTLTIGRRLWASFGLCLAALLTITAVNINNQAAVKSEVNEIVNEAHPAVRRALNLSLQVQAGVSALTLYLLGQDDAQLRDFRDRLLIMKSEVSSLNKSGSISTNADARKTFKNLKQQLLQFEALSTKLITLTADVNANFPGVAFSLERVTPSDRKITKLIAQAHKETRLEALWPELQELRFGWRAVMRSLSNYLVYRDATSIAQLEIHRETITPNSEADSDHDQVKSVSPPGTN